MPKLHVRIMALFLVSALVLGSIGPVGAAPCGMPLQFHESFEGQALAEAFVDALSSELTYTPSIGRLWRGLMGHAGRSLALAGLLSVGGMMVGQSNPASTSHAPPLSLNMRQQETAGWFNPTSTDEFSFHFLPRFGARSARTLPPGYYPLADFESQSTAILIQAATLAADADLAILQKLPLDMTKYLVVSNDAEGRTVREWLAASGIRDPKVRVVIAPAEASYSPWARDSYIVLATPDKRLVMAQPWAFGHHGPELSDPLAAFIAGRLGGSSVYPIDLDFVGGDFQVGIRPNGKRDVFISLDLESDNMAQGHSQVSFERAKIQLFGQEPIVLDSAYNGSHLDMYITPGPQGKVAVADPRLAIKALGRLSDSEKVAYMKSLQDEINRLSKGTNLSAKIDDQALVLASRTADSFDAVFDKVAQDLANLGYHVSRMPWIAYHPASTTAEKTGMPDPNSVAGIEFSYNNVFYVNATTLLMPIYHLPSDAVAEKTYRDMGLNVIKVPMETLAYLGGSVHCSINRVSVQGFKGGPTDFGALTILPAFNPQDPRDGVFVSDLRRQNYLRYSDLLKRTSPKDRTALLMHFLSHPQANVRQSILDFMLMDNEVEEKNVAIPVVGRQGLFGQSEVRDRLADISLYDADRNVSGLAGILRSLYTPALDLVNEVRTKHLQEPAKFAAIDRLRDDYRERVRKLGGHPLIEEESRLVVGEGGLTSDYRARVGGTGRSAAPKMSELLGSPDSSARRHALHYLIVMHYQRFDSVSGPAPLSELQPAVRLEDDSQVSERLLILALSDPDFSVRSLAYSFAGHLAREDRDFEEGVRRLEQSLNQFHQKARASVLAHLLNFYVYIHGPAQDHNEQTTLDNGAEPEKALTDAGEFPWNAVLGIGGGLLAIGIVGLGWVLYRRAHPRVTTLLQRTPIPLSGMASAEANLWRSGWSLVWSWGIDRQQPPRPALMLETQRRGFDLADLGSRIWFSEVNEAAGRNVPSAAYVRSMPKKALAFQVRIPASELNLPTGVIPLQFDANSTHWKLSLAQKTPEGGMAFTYEVVEQSGSSTGKRKPDRTSA